MKIIRKEETQAKAEILLSLIETRKVNDKREKELKDFFKVLMKDETTLKVGSVLITLEDRERNGLDKKAILADTRYGTDFVAAFNKTSYFTQMNVKGL